MTRRLAVAALALTLVVAACADDETAAPSTTAADGDTSAPATTQAAAAPDPTTTTATTQTTAPTTTTAATTTTSPLDPTAYDDAGPFPVGVTTLALPTGQQVEVWYPAAAGTSGEVTYDVRDFVPPAIRDLLVGDVPSTFTYAAGRDAPPADGRFPVVLFSHGFTGFRLQSTFLTSHLASWGMVVAAPDHPSRDMFHVLEGTASGDVAESVTDLLATLDLVVAQFGDRVDAERVAAVGHSAGGGTILGAAADDRIDGYVSMASGGPDATADYPIRPSFFLAGSVDAVVEPARTRATFELAPGPTSLWEIDGVGHNGFDDLCTFGGGTGIIGVAEASGLGPVLDANPRLRALGQDGCVPPAAPVEQGFPIIRHGVTAWLRVLFGDDAEPVGLGPEIAAAFDLPVTVTSR